MAKCLYFHFMYKVFNLLYKFNIFNKKIKYNTIIPQLKELEKYQTFTLIILLLIGLNIGHRQYFQFF